MYDQGVGVEQSYEKAFFWAFKSAVQGNTKAQIMVGQMHFTGQGVKQNQVVGLAWVMLAFDAGSEYANFAGTRLMK